MGHDMPAMKYMKSKWKSKPAPLWIVLMVRVLPSQEVVHSPPSWNGGIFLADFEDAHRLLNQVYGAGRVSPTKPYCYKHNMASYAYVLEHSAHVGHIMICLTYCRSCRSVGWDRIIDLKNILHTVMHKQYRSCRSCRSASWKLVQMMMQSVKRSVWSVTWSVKFSPICPTCIAVS